MRIMIADDSVLVRRALAAVVAQTKGWDVCGEAANGLEAMEMARKSRPDLILLDFRLPGADGLEVARQLRAERPDLAIVIMSVEDPVLLSDAALAAGANACLDKYSLGSELARSLRGFEAGAEPALRENGRKSRAAEA